MKIIPRRPSIKDWLGVQSVSSDWLESCASIAFLGPDDILVLEKEKDTDREL